jgi:hypothetical protein
MAKSKKPTKSNSKAKSSKKPAPKAAARPKASGKSTLGGFYRKLWSKPDMMEKFSSSPAGRDAVIAQSNLTPAHQKLVAKGCLRDVMQELAGVRAVAGANNTVNNVVSANGGVDCGHAECQAFMNAVKSA